VPDINPGDACWPSSPNRLCASAWRGPVALERVLRSSPCQPSGAGTATRCHAASPRAAQPRRDPGPIHRAVGEARAAVAGSFVIAVSGFRSESRQFSRLPSFSPASGSEKARCRDPVTGRLCDCGRLLSTAPPSQEKPGQAGQQAEVPLLVP